MAPWLCWISLQRRMLAGGTFMLSGCVWALNMRDEEVTVDLLFIFNIHSNTEQHNRLMVSVHFICLITWTVSRTIEAAMVQFTVSFTLQHLSGFLFLDFPEATKTVGDKKERNNGFINLVCLLCRLIVFLLCRYYCTFHVQEYSQNSLAESKTFITAALTSGYETDSFAIQTIGVAIKHIGKLAWRVRSKESCEIIKKKKTN